MMGYIFISYSHKDKAYVHKLQESLQKEGFEIWIDDRIDYGTQWPKVIQDHLDACEAFIVVVSENSYESEWVQNEVARARRKGKPFFPLLLQGDPWLSVEATQYVDVSDGSLPTEKFFNRLSNQASRRKIRIASSFHPMNTESMGPSGIEAEIKKKNAQRFLYLKCLYELSNGNTLSYFQFTEIGKELGWKDEITDETIDYLKDDGLIDFPSFGTVSITHAGIKHVEDSLNKADIHAEPFVDLINTVPNQSTTEIHLQSSSVINDFPRPQIPIEVDSQEVIRFFAFIESTLDRRFKTLESAGVTVQKSVDTGNIYSYQVSTS